MYLFSIGTSNTNTAERELQAPGRIDPRPNNHPFSLDGALAFRITYGNNNRTVTFTKIIDERSEDDGWGLTRDGEELNFRVYELDGVPRFDTTMYTYMGVRGEYAPWRTTLVTIHRNTNIIRAGVFRGYDGLELCLIHDDVETIEEDAFSGCTAMSVVRLPRNLRWIGPRAFQGCSGLSSLFIPSGVSHIGDDAFCGATEIRVVSFPPNIRLEDIGNRVMRECETFFQVTEIQGYQYAPNEDDIDVAQNSGEVHQSVLNFYRNDVTRLHRVCLKTDVTSHEIQEVVSDDDEETSLLDTDHNDMTPLHILAMNPHTPPECIAAFIWLEPNAAFMVDALGNTPLDYLTTNAKTRTVGDNGNALVALIEALIRRRAYMMREMEDDTDTACSICCWPFSRRSE